MTKVFNQSLFFESTEKDTILNFSLYAEKTLFNSLTDNLQGTQERLVKSRRINFPE